MSNDQFGYQSPQTDRSQNTSSAGIAEMATTAGGQIGDAAHQAKEVAKEQYDNLTGAIRAKPMQAVGIAMGVGFVLALLARR
jgi:ElaB/YqjD/DUF883 family membrane-anchored ribosome-binding protein